jgi:hypothetical protein
MIFCILLVAKIEDEQREKNISAISMATGAMESKKKCSNSIFILTRYQLCRLIETETYGCAAVLGVFSNDSSREIMFSSLATQSFVVEVETMPDNAPFSNDFQFYSLKVVSLLSTTLEPTMDITFA